MLLLRETMGRVIARWHFARRLLVIETSPSLADPGIPSIKNTGYGTVCVRRLWHGYDCTKVWWKCIAPQSSRVYREPVRATLRKSHAQARRLRAPRFVEHVHGARRRAPLPPEELAIVQLHELKRAPLPCRRGGAPAAAGARIVEAPDLAAGRGRGRGLLLPPHLQPLLSPHLRAARHGSTTRDRWWEQG